MMVENMWTINIGSLFNIKGRGQGWMKSVVEGELFFKVKKTLASLNVNKNIGKEKRVENTKRKLIT